METSGQPEACSAEGEGPILTTQAPLLLFTSPLQLFLTSALAPTCEEPHSHEVCASHTHVPDRPQLLPLRPGVAEAPLLHISLSETHLGNHGLGGDGHEWGGSYPKPGDSGSVSVGTGMPHPSSAEGERTPVLHSPPSAAPPDRGKIQAQFVVPSECRFAFRNLRVQPDSGTWPPETHPRYPIHTGVSCL